MTSSAAGYDAPPSPTYVSLGQTLAEARRARGLTLAAAAVATTIREPYLVAIENGSIINAVAAVYARGYVRAYAAYLGVELEPEPPPRLVALSGFEDERPSRFPLPGWLVLTRPVLAALGGLILILAFAGYAFYEFRSARDIMSPPKTTPAAATAPIANPMPLPSDAAPAPTPTSQQPGVAVVSIRATEHIWVSITADGRATGRFMEAGDEVTYSAQRVSIAAGKPTLQVSVDGGPYTTMGVLSKDYTATAH